MSENGSAAPNPENGANEFVFTEEQINALVVKKFKGSIKTFDYPSVQKLLTQLGKKIQLEINNLIEDEGMDEENGFVKRLKLLKKRIDSVIDLFDYERINNKLEGINFNDDEAKQGYLDNLFDDLLDCKIETQKFIDDVAENVEHFTNWVDPLKDKSKSVEFKLDWVKEKFYAYKELLDDFHKTTGSTHSRNEENFRYELNEYKKILGEGRSLHDLKEKAKLFDKLAEKHVKKRADDHIKKQFFIEDEDEKNSREEFKKTIKTQDLAEDIENEFNSLNQLENELESKEDELLKTKKKYNEYMFEHTYSDESYNKLESEKKVLSTEVNDLKTKIDSLENENKNLKDQADAFNAKNTDETIKTLKDQVDSLTSQVNSLTTEKDQATNKLNSLQTEYDDYKNNHSYDNKMFNDAVELASSLGTKNASLKNDITEYDARVITLENEKNTLLDKNKSLQEQIDALNAENKEATITDLTTQIANLNNSIGSLNTEKNELQTKLTASEDKAAKLKANLENANNKLSAKDNDINSKNEEIKALKDQIQAYKDVDPNKGNQNLIDTLNKQIADLRTAKTNSENSLNTKITNLTNKKNDLDRDLKDANKNIDDLTKKKDKADTDLKTANNKLANLEKKYYALLNNSGNIDEQLKNQLANTEKENKSLIDQKNQLEAGLKEKNNQINKLENDKKNLQNQLDAQKKLNDLIGKGDLGGQVKNLTETVKKLQDDIDQKQKLINEKDKKIQELSTGDGKPHEPGEKSDEVEEMKRKIKELEDKNKKLEEENDKLKENKNEPEEKSNDTDVKVLVQEVEISVPSKAGNVALVTASGVGTVAGVAGISASLLLKAGIMSSILGIGGPVLIIILGGTGLAFGICNLIEISNMKRPLKMLNDKLKKPNSKEPKDNSKDQEEKS